MLLLQSHRCMPSESVLTQSTAHAVKVNRSKMKLIGFSLGLALLHYAVFTVSYVRAEVIHPGPGHVWWQRASEVLAFPLGYLADAPLPVDIFPIAVIANSHHRWGSSCALARNPSR